jgi:aromatic ring-cleaving dioxygenase
VIRDYHFHLYFMASRRASAEAIQQRLMAQREFAVEVSTLRDGPGGPHLLPQFWATVLPDAFEAAVRWYVFNHAEHSVLVHPSTGHDLRDHTQHALWLGERMPLDYSVLGPS